MSVDQALSLLWQAARPSPSLREAVELVEAEVQRLTKALNDLAEAAEVAAQGGIHGAQIRRCR